jgi:SAM-dependent methyltransferase
MTSELPQLPLPDAEVLRRTFRADADDDATVAEVVFILDAQDAAPSVERLRRWGLDGLGDLMGKEVVDVGCGTGTMVRRLASAVGPKGRVTGIEPNPKLRDVALKRGAANVVDAMGNGLPLKDGSVDFVWCERVLQHTAAPEEILAEIFRVLRPGGTAVILDSDHATRVVSDVDESVEEAVRTTFVTAIANGRSARLIPRQLVDAGFEVGWDVGSAALVFPLDGSMMMPLMHGIGGIAIADGLLTDAQLQVGITDMVAAGHRGHAFTSVTMFGFHARKPVD